ncbi:hypothetical protein CBS147338_8007 [Penicillium roqueforti]|nr:hypothetical protein CBS147338_8007 [Penicillium roqueforti]
MRLPYVADPPATSTPDEARILASVQARRAPNPLLPLDLALLHSYPVTEGWNSFIGAIRTRTTLTTVVRELAICRVAVVNGALFEWEQHAPLLVEGGLGSEALQFIRDTQADFSSEAASSVLSAEQRAVLKYTDAMTKTVTVPDEVFAELRGCFDEREVVEITATIAAYNCEIMQTIIQHCPTITELELDLNEWVRPDYLQYIQRRRASLASLLGVIPDSLRVLHYNGSEDGPWKHSLPGLNVIPSGIDSLAINLRNLSVHLRELKLARTTLPFDFLCPLDGKGQPIIGSLHWPYLKTLEIQDVPPWLPCGQWTSNHTVEYRAKIENDNWNDRIHDAERRWNGTSVMNDEQFHRLLISLGYATQRMPCLKRMTFRMECYCRFSLHLHNHSNASTLEWQSRAGYQPDSRVAKAWKFDLDDLRIDSSPLGICSVILPRWPPDEPI